MLYPDNPTIQWLTVLDKPIYSNIFDGQGNPRPAVENEMFEKWLVWICISATECSGQQGWI